MLYSGRCDRCKQPYEKELEDSARINAYVDCGPCGGLVALVREDKKPVESNPMKCGDCHSVMKYSPRHRHFICPTCEAKG